MLPWSRHQGGSSQHIHSPRTQHPAALPCTQQDHQSHPDRERKFIILAQNDYAYTATFANFKTFPYVYASKASLKKERSEKYRYIWKYREIQTWQESFPPSRNPAQNMVSSIMPG